MENRPSAGLFCCAVLISFGVSLAAEIGAGAENGKLLTGKAAMGDWTSDAPGVRRKITVEDLPAPGSNLLAINPPHVVERPADAQLRAPPGFKIDMYASEFRDPRFLLTAPNGDIFVIESHANQIKVLRDTKNTGKPDVTEIFAERDVNKPFGIAFYPPGNDPQFLYVANTDGVIRFPYRNGDLKAHAPAEKLARTFPAARRLYVVEDTGHVTWFSRPTARKCMSQSARARTIPTMRRKQIARASSNSIPMAADKKFMLGEFETLSGSRFVRAATNSG